ncbi:MAG: site-specific integrase [Henriciella sp.]
MKKAVSEYVYARGNGIYYFRRAVPSDLRGEIGKREWKVSLGTQDVGKAFAKAAKLSSKIEIQIAQLRGEAEGATPIDRDVPASDQQVLATMNALFSRDRTIRAGRMDGRIEHAIIDGENAQQLLDRLIADLDELDVVTPLALPTSKLDRFLGPLQQRTGRDIRADRSLVRKLAASYLQNEKRILETQIAQLRGDQAEVERLSKRATKEPSLVFLVDLYREQMGAQWRSKTRTKFENVSRVLIDVLGADTKISAVNREIAREFSDVLHSLPTNYLKRKELSGLSARDAAARGATLKMPTLGYKSLKVYLAYATSIFKFAVNEDLTAKNPMRGLQVRAPMPEISVKKPSPEEIQKIFNAPVFTGCEDDLKNWRQPAPSQIRRGRFWVPILALHSGMRLGEVCSLQAKDIQSLHGVTLFNLVDNEERRLKTKNAARIIPIHHQLIRLGFIEWLEERNFAPDEYLFNELPVNSNNNRSDAFSKWFGRFRKSIGLSGRKTSMHGLRHLFSDLLLATNPGKINQKRIMGWAQDDMLDVYGDGRTVKLFNEYVQKVEFQDFDISHLSK